MGDIMEIKNSTAMIISSLVISANNGGEEDISPDKVHEVIERLITGHEDCSTELFIEDYELAIRCMKIANGIVIKNIRKAIKRKLKEQDQIDTALAHVIIDTARKDGKEGG